jgi:hypothetical protein
LAIEPEDVPDQEVARSGKIVSSTDSKAQGKDYTPWLILLGLLIFSFAVSSASYYGLSWLGMTKFTGEDSQIPGDIVSKESETSVSQQSDESEDDEQHLRW